MRDGLIELGVTSLENAEQTASRRKDLQKDFDAGEKNLRELLGEFESLENLEEHTGQLAAQTEALSKSVAATEAERAESVAELDAQSERLGVRLKDQQGAQTIASNELKKLRRLAEQQADARENADKERLKLSRTETSLDEQIRSLLARYPQGIEEVKTNMQGIFVRAEAHRNEARKKLSPDFDKLPDRSRRASKAAEETRLEMDRRRDECSKLEGALQQLGAEGLHSQDCQLVERKESVYIQAESLRTHGWAARLVRDLIELRQQAATRCVLGPLESRLSNTFAEITGNWDRRVFLGDQLQINGVGATREAMIQFEHLSQGAKEQLLLSLRLAVAGEISANGHKLVILDDVLVNTDNQRQERVLDVLKNAAGQLQILILTCHAERYRGVGDVVEIRTE